MTLSKEEEAQLAELFEQPGMRVLKKVFESKIIELGIDALNSRTVEFTAERRGFRMALDWCYKDLKGIHAKVYNLEQKAKQ